jgi:mono/diheme cytochrome c family protein|tara:strand:+ start:13 stop:444 length:432 start_codon:yes stop_codon:yes gene_type:complete
MKLFSFIILLIAINLTLFYNYSNNSSYETAQSKVLKESIKRGNAVYSDFCINCHLPNGEGVQNIYPPLANSDYLKANRRTSIKGVKYGLKGEITVNGLQYNKYMPPMGLSANEISDVMNYTNHSWGNKYGKIVTTKEVTEIIR